MKIEEITFNKLIGTYIQLLIKCSKKWKKVNFKNVFRHTTLYFVFCMSTLQIYFPNNDEDLTMKNVWKEMNISV